MADDVTRFIEALIDKHGVWKVIAAPFMIIPIAVAFGALADGPYTSLVAGMVALLESFILVVALASQLRKERALRLRRDAVVRRLTDTIIQSKGSSYTWEVWRENVQVSAGGDVVVRQWRTLRAHEDSEVGVVWAALEQTPRGTLTARDKRAVRVTANSWYHVNGVDIIGAGYDVAEVWRDDADALAVYLSPERPIGSGKTMNILHTWYWPGFYRYLLNGGRDIVSFVRKKGVATRIELSLTFDHSCGLDHNIRIRPLDGCPVPSKVVHDDGSIEFRATYGPDQLPEYAGLIIDNSKF